MTAGPHDDGRPLGVPGHIVYALNQRLERLATVKSASRNKRFALMRNESRFARQLARQFSLDAETTERIVTWHSSNTITHLRRFSSASSSPGHATAYVVARPTSVMTRAVHSRLMRHAVGWVPSWTNNRAVDVESAWLRLMGRP
jgi:hypothetical protein